MRSKIKRIGFLHCTNCLFSSFLIRYHLGVLVARFLPSSIASSDSSEVLWIKLSCEISKKLFSTSSDLFKFKEGLSSSFTNLAFPCALEILGIDHLLATDF